MDLSHLLRQSGELRWLATDAGHLISCPGPRVRSGPARNRRATPKQPRRDFDGISSACIATLMLNGGSSGSVRQKRPKVRQQIAVATPNVDQ